MKYSSVLYIFAILVSISINNQMIDFDIGTIQFGLFFISFEFFFVFDVQCFNLFCVVIHLITSWTLNTKKSWRL